MTVTAGITAVEPGSSGNSLAAGAEMVLYIGNPAIYRIVVTTAASGGDEEEEDDVYRERIRQHTLTAVTTGPASQYEGAAKAVSSDVVDARAYQIAPSEVGVLLIVADGADSSAVIQQVTAALSEDTVRPLTDIVTVTEATDVPYVLNVNYTTDGSSAVSSAIAEAVSSYQEWQDNTIEQAFNPDRLMAALYQAGATRVTWGAGSNFDGGTVEYTELDITERCKGTITLTEITT